MFTLNWKLYALAAVAFAAGLIGWRASGIRAAIKRERSKLERADYERAKDIEDDVSRSRADPAKLRKFDGAGWRD